MNKILSTALIIGFCVGSLTACSMEKKQDASATQDTAAEPAAVAAPVEAQPAEVAAPAADEPAADAAE